MSDMLVKLYEIPDYSKLVTNLNEKNIYIRRAIVPEKHHVVNWVKDKFGQGWANECETAFSRQPVSCFIAVKNKIIIGFACYDVTCKNFFGPTGVSDDLRGMGIGKALLLISLNSMKVQGYAYAIIGGVGPKEFYERVVGAKEIENSTPGIYKDMIE